MMTNECKCAATHRQDCCCEAMTRKEMMGEKSRANWNIAYCCKAPACANANKRCYLCLRWSEYKEKEGSK